MLTSNRLKALKKWTEENVCKGKMMKTMPENGDITKILRQEPPVYLGWWPKRRDETGAWVVTPYNVCPGILISPGLSYAQAEEEKRFDRYSHILRPKELGQTLTVTVLFSVYEPGTRYPGFVESAKAYNGMDMSLISEGTEEGLFALTDWMDEFKDKLLAQKTIPESDLTVDDAEITYSPYMDSEYIVDKRPIFYGFVTAKFNCYSRQQINEEVQDILK